MPPIKANRKFISAGQRDKEMVNVKKAKFTLEQAMKAQRGSRGITLLFL